MSPLLFRKTRPDTPASPPRLWRDALLRVPSEARVKQVLILGIDGGNSLRAARKRWPNAHVTVIESDPLRIDALRRRQKAAPKNPPEIRVGNPPELLAKTQGTFDLILADVPTILGSGAPSAESALVADLARVVETDGYLVLSLSDRVTAVSATEALLSRHGSWRFGGRTLALFRHYGQGRAGEPLPRGFVHQQQSPDYLLGGWPADAVRAQLVGSEECWGMRWHYGPFWIEAYTSDVPPVIDRTAHSRMVIWQPITKLGKPAGWHRSWIQMNSQQHGFADIQDKPEYWKEWTGHAQRHLKKWLKDERYETVEVSVEEFAAAYHRTGKLGGLRKDFVRLLERRIEHHGQNVRLFASRDKATREIISGLAICDLPDVSVSMHVIAYILPKYEKTSVGIGLIDHWYRHCREAGIRFPHFGLVWAPGDPNGWKGYSNFKRQFNLHLLRYPMPLIKFVRQRSKV